MLNCSYVFSGIFKKQVLSLSVLQRLISTSKRNTCSKTKALILGVYTKPSTVVNYSEIANFTVTTKEIDKVYQGKFTDALKGTGPFCKAAKHKFFYSSGIPGLSDFTYGGIKYDSLVVIDLGDENLKNELEERDQKLESIRCAISDGIKAINRNGRFEEIHFDSCGNPQCVAETAALTLFAYDELKKESSRRPNISVQLCNSQSSTKSFTEGWERGIIIGESQNFARMLMETPANLMTPEIFAAKVAEKVKHVGVDVISRNLEWIEDHRMGSFLSVSKGSEEKPVFLELHYQGNPDVNAQCLALVGKGITFDSGGISLKPSAEMDKMRADMGGAACVSSAIHAIANLKLKLNVKGFIPLCENMPSGKANKPGDVVYAMNGKSIMIDNTDAEGRLILADALCYAQTFNPFLVIDVATLTGAIMVALGGAATGVFSNDNHFWELLHKAGYNTGDRVWRMPLFKHYSKQVTDCHLADINNVGKSGRYGGACKAAAFLREFIGTDMKWMHLDIASVMENNDESPYMCKGMSGRPTRTLVEFLRLVTEELNVNVNK